MEIIIGALLALLMLTGNASALGIPSTSFIDVEPGKMYTQTVLLIHSDNDFNNRYVIEIYGAIQDWIAVSPKQFNLNSGDIKEIKLKLNMPKDVHFREKRGTITAIGKKTVPITPL